MAKCAKVKALFANSGILGHHSVSRLIQEVTHGTEWLQASHLNLSEELTTFERVVRSVLCFHPCRGNYDLARWRQEFNAGWLTAKRIRQLDGSHGPFDLLHLHPQPLGYCSLRRMARTPTIVSIDATQALAISEASPRERWTFRPNVLHDDAVFRRARGIITTSRWAADHLAREHPQSASKAKVMPYPIDVSRFGSDWIEQRRSRSSNPNYKPVVLFMGGDFPRKGGFDLLRAWQEAGLSSLARLALVTHWPLDISQLPVGVEVKQGIAGYSLEWFQCWLEADLFVMPTKSEAFGMVYQEAAAAGLPAVGTRITAIPELVIEGHTGLLVEPGDSRSLSDSIERLVRSPDLRADMGRKGRLHMEQLCSPARYAGELLDMIQSLVNRN